jgi:hypothetical protein
MVAEVGDERGDDGGAAAYFSDGFWFRATGFNKQITIFVCELQFCYGSMTRGNYKFEWVRLKALS